MFSQWSKRGKEIVFRTRFSENGEHPANIAATCAKRGIPRSPSCLVLHLGEGEGWIKYDSGGHPFGLNYQSRPLHATNVYNADARRAAGFSAYAVRRIYIAQNSADVPEHVATTCSS